MTIPIRSLGGNLIEPVRYENGLYIASAFEKAPGVLAEGMSPAEWSDELFQALGRTLGQCHKLAELFDVLVVYAGLDRASFGAHFLEHLLKEYHPQKPISQFWVNQLPHFLKLLVIGVYVILCRSYDPATADEWVNKFMPGRRHRIEQGIPYVDLDFEASCFCV